MGCLVEELIVFGVTIFCDSLNFIKEAIYLGMNTVTPSFHTLTF